MSALRISDSSADSVMTMMDDLGFDNNSRNKITKKIFNLSVRCTYYIPAAEIKHGRIWNLRVLKKFTYKLSTSFTFSFFHFTLILIICLHRRANNTLPVISEVHHCNFNYIMKCDIKFKKISNEKQHYCFTSFLFGPRLRSRSPSAV